MDYSVYNIDSYYDVNGLQDSTEIKFIQYSTRDEFWRGRNEFGWSIGKESPLNITHYNARNVPFIGFALQKYLINFKVK